MTQQPTIDPTCSRPQTLAEEVANAITHGLGLVAAIAALPILILVGNGSGDAYRMVGSVIQSLFTDANNYPAAGAISMILMLLVLVMVVLFVRRAGTEELL